MRGNKTRQLISLLLLLPVMAPLLFIVINDLGKWEIKLWSHDRPDENSALVHLQIPANNVHWMDKREIFADGKMFDIKSQELKNGVYYFTGHFDTKETSLQQKQKAAHEQHDDALLQLFKSLQQLYYDPAEATVFWPAPVILKKQTGNNTLRTVVLDVQTPPPQHCFSPLI